MTQFTTRYVRHLLLASLVLVLFGACSSTPKPGTSLSAQQLAERAYAKGDYKEAAQYWQQASLDASVKHSNSLRLKTADAWLRSGKVNRAAELLLQVDQNLLNQQDLTLFNVTQAEMALQKGDIGLAGVYLQIVLQPISADMKHRFDTLQDRVYMARHPSSLNMTELATLTRKIPDYQAGPVLEVLRSLEYVSTGQLQNMIDQQQYDPEFTEWLELTLQIRASVVGPESSIEAATKWTIYHFGHPVGRNSYVDLVSRYRALYPAPAQVAVLLPDEGGLVGAGRAIRDGIVSAYLERPGDSILRFYSSGDNNEAAVVAYQQAITDGATQVVGPLRIESTRAIGKLAQSSVPVLLLNDSPMLIPDGAPRPGNVSSISLSQAEEAATIANMALQHAHKEVIVLVPDSAWGVRIEAAFASTFEQGNGLVTATARFDTTTDDHSAMLTRLLKIDESRERKADLQSRLGVPLTFEPTRRHDFDFIFLAANPIEGRGIKPLLRFHDVGNVPVYAMGRIFSGQIQRAPDQDLNGIVFPITYWQLEHSRRIATMPGSVRKGTFGNLFALGQDAWKLLPWLPLMQKDPDLLYAGSIGILRLQENGHIFRDPAWAQFSAGRPIPYQWSPNPDL